MTNMPYEKLIAYQKARAFLVCVTEASISDSQLREQALRAARSTCHNISEAVGRQSPADKARVYGIARGELCEAASALDIAAASRLCRAEPAQTGAGYAREVYVMLTALMRRT